MFDQNINLQFWRCCSRYLRTVKSVAEIEGGDETIAIRSPVAMRRVLPCTPAEP